MLSKKTLLYSDLKNKLILNLNLGPGRFGNEGPIQILEEMIKRIVSM